MSFSLQTSLVALSVGLSVGLLGCMGSPDVTSGSWGVYTEDAPEDDAPFISDLPDSRYVAAGPCAGFSDEDDRFCSFRSGVPDHDQWRRDLVREGGFHCAPASAANVLGYLSTLGMAPGYESLGRAPTIDTRELLCSSEYAMRFADPSAHHAIYDPLCAGTDAYVDGDSPRDDESFFWDNVSDLTYYTAATHLIEDLGFEMSTGGRSDAGDPFDPETPGTDFAPFWRTLQNHLEGYASVTPIAGAKCAEGSFGPRLIHREMQRGAIHVVVVGFYEDSDGDGRLERTGGHFVTVNGIRRDGGERRLYLRDSARWGTFSDINRDRQDPFRTEVATLTSEIVDHAEGCSKDRWRIEWAGGERVGYLESLVTIEPY